jgi:hypothetical protein
MSFWLPERRGHPAGYVPALLIENCAPDRPSVVLLLISTSMINASHLRSRALVTDRPEKCELLRPVAESTELLRLVTGHLSMPDELGQQFLHRAFRTCIDFRT